MKAAPKQEEKVAWGSTIPRSVPATLAVYLPQQWEGGGEREYHTVKSYTPASGY
jgi:hypothetical protein